MRLRGLAGLVESRRGSFSLRPPKLALAARRAVDDDVVRQPCRPAALVLAGDPPALDALQAARVNGRPLDAHVRMVPNQGEARPLASHPGLSSRTHGLTASSVAPPSRSRGTAEKGSQGPAAATGRTGSRKSPCPTDQSVKRGLLRNAFCELSAWEGMAATTPRRRARGAANGAPMRGRL